MEGVTLHNFAYIRRRPFAASRVLLGRSCRICLLSTPLKTFKLFNHSVTTYYSANSTLIHYKLLNLPEPILHHYFIILFLWIEINLIVYEEGVFVNKSFAFVTLGSERYIYYRHLFGMQKKSRANELYDL